MAKHKYFQLQRGETPSNKTVPEEVSEEGTVVLRLVGYDVLRKFSETSRYRRFMTVTAK